MDNDITAGEGTRAKKTIKTLEPVNDLSTPKVPHFSTLEDSATPSVTDDNSNHSATSPSPVPVQTPPKHHAHTWSLTKKKRLVFALVAALLILTAGAAAFFLQPHPTTVITTSKKHTPAVKKPQPIYSNLSGAPVDASVNKRPVTGVMIENSEAARPQSGLDQASVVFEAIAEGGITRFMALYQDNEPAYIGPVRSARPYYLDWCLSFDCALAHVGGSPEALADITNWGVKNLDQFFNGAAYWRINSRYAPHNVYTTLPNLAKLESAKGYGAASFTSFVRKNDTPSATPNATSIDVNISGAAYNSHYDWDKTTDSYKRSQAGAPHMVVNADGSQVQLQPKVVVALIMSYGLEADGEHSVYGNIGSGEALVFQDGTMTHGTWHKADRNAALTLTNDAGKPLGLNGGQRWFVALSGTNQVSYR